MHLCDSAASVVKDPGRRWKTRSMFSRYNLVDKAARAYSAYLDQSVAAGRKV